MQNFLLFFIFLSIASLLQCLVLTWITWYIRVREVEFESRLKEKKMEDWASGGYTWRPKWKLLSSLSFGVPKPFAGHWSPYNNAPHANLIMASTPPFAGGCESRLPAFQKTWPFSTIYPSSCTTHSKQTQSTFISKCMKLLMCSLSLSHTPMSFTQPSHKCLKP